MILLGKTRFIGEFMQGRHCYQPKLFMYVPIDSLIAENHFLRKIDKILDLSSVRELTAPFYCSSNGRASIDPELYFRMVLIGYLYGITSDSQLCEEIQYNLAYGWFCRLSLEDRIPDHSSMTRIRDRLGEAVFQQLFEKVVLLCQEKGLIKGESLMTDSTLIKANASLASLISRNAKNKEEFKGNGLTPPAKRSVSNQTHKSATDPEATLAHKKGTAKSLKYKVHKSIDSKSLIILDCYVTTGSVHDSQPYLERLEYISTTFQIKPKEVIADRAYGSAEILDSLIKKQIKPNIPLFSSLRGSSSPAEESGFVFDLDADHYRCPEGKLLTPCDPPTAERRRYRASINICRSYPHLSNCIPNPTLRNRGKMIRRNKHQVLFEYMNKEMRSFSFISKLTERMWKMEGIISEAKNLHGLKEAKYRGQHKVQIQAYMTATVQNLKRLMAELGFCRKMLFLNFSLVSRIFKVENRSTKFPGHLIISESHFFNSADRFTDNLFLTIIYSKTPKNMFQNFVSNYLFCDYNEKSF